MKTFSKQYKIENNSYQLSNFIPIGRVICQPVGDLGGIDRPGSISKERTKDDVDIIRSRKHVLEKPISKCFLECFFNNGPHQWCLGFEIDVVLVLLVNKVSALSPYGFDVRCIITTTVVVTVTLIDHATSFRTQVIF